MATARRWRTQSSSVSTIWCPRHWPCATKQPPSRSPPRKQLRHSLSAVLVENTEKAAEATALENRQKRFGPYIVHVVDSTNARVQLRVQSTGRVVTDRRAGNAGRPVWFATRRLTKTSGDATQPHGTWLGSHDRNALPSAERAKQASLDEKESKFRAHCSVARHSSSRTTSGQ